MIPLLTLLPCPLLIVVVAAVSRRVSVLTRSAALLLWLQMALALWYWAPFLRTGSPVVHGGFTCDPTAAYFILLTTLVVAAALTHAVGFFAREMDSDHPPLPRHVAQVYLFVPLFLIAMYAVVSADNLGYLWIGMEATTLLSAPLVYFHRSRTSLEATWKYLIICSVGIAFGFFGTALLFAASQHVGALGGGSLSVAALTAQARLLPPGLLRLSFVFILLGYGTKAGLFPLHSWLPDAHSEAPAPISAILSGSLLNCALVVLWRTSGLLAAAGQGRLVRETLLPLGAATVVAAALFLLKQRDIKRLLAYSSMENVGLMAVAIALHSSAGFALQALNHSLVKVALFLLAGNLLQQFGTKKIRDMHGLLAGQPVQAVLLFLLVAAVAGTPPFGSFLSEWQILSVAADHRQIATAVALLAALALAMIALTIHAAGILFGGASPRLSPGVGRRRTVSLVAVPLLLLAGTLWLGVALTPALLALAGGLAR